MREKQERIVENYYNLTDDYYRYIKKELKKISSEYPELFQYNKKDKEIASTRKKELLYLEIPQAGPEETSALKPNLTAEQLLENIQAEILKYKFYEREDVEKQLKILYEKAANDETLLAPVQEFMNVVEMLRKCMLPKYEEFKSKMEEALGEMLDKINLISEDFNGGEIITEDGQTNAFISLPEKNTEDTIEENTN